jgi:PAS domain S-box-containing protein
LRCNRYLKALNNAVAENIPETILDIASLTPEVTRAWLAAIVDSSEDAIVSKNLESIVRSWNAGAEQLFGYTAEEMIGQSITRIIPNELLDEEAKILSKLRRGERVEHFETVRLRKDGRRVHVSLTISPIKDATGRVVGASKIARDITKRKEIEAALQQVTAALTELNQELENRVRHRTADLEKATAALRREIEQQKLLEAQLRQAQKMESLGTLAGGIAHDFNNILNIILGYSSAISGDTDPQQLAENVKVIKESVARGAQVVQQLLAIGRKAPLSFEPIGLNRLLEDNAALIGGSFPKTIEIRLRLDAGLPPTAVDANRLNQAILNLCVNARDAMKGTGTIELATGRVSGETLRGTLPEAAEANYIWLSVSDTGPGIERAAQERIFEPFFTTKAPGEGSGLGLAVVYGIVRDHNGFIDVQSEPGKGATFRIYLPERNAEAASHIDAPSAGVATHANGATVLIADDEESQLRLMERFLRDAGFAVLTARNGVEAVELHRTHDGVVSVAVLDLGLPKLSGWESYRAMRERDPAIGIVFASGYIDPAVKNEIERDDDAAIIKKPYSPEELLAKISTMAEQRSR